MNAGAVVLAAGKASRFGAPKQLLEIDGETLIDRACRTALEAECQPVLRVLGAHAGLILEKTCPVGVETLVHAAWEDGMGGSLAAGLARLLEISPEIEAVFVLLTDQPLVTSGLLATMKDKVVLEGSSVVWCDHGAAKGPPALFGKEHFAELLALRGDRGAKSVAAMHHAEVVAFPNGVWDIDAPKNWEMFTGRRLEP